MKIRNDKSRVIGSKAFLVAMVFTGLAALTVGTQLYFEHLDQLAAEKNLLAQAEAMKLRYDPPWFNKARFSRDAPTSFWVVANKKRPINPIDYAPAKLLTVQGIEIDQRIEPAMNDMIAAAARDGAELRVISGYRSYETQMELLDGYTARDGQKMAETFAARPGYSEHQLGTTADFDNTSGGCTLDGCFGKTAAGIWLAQNAGRFGFIQRYPEGKTDITGYIPESWHFRYVGKDLASEMKKQNIDTLEEFFGLKGGQYPN